MGGQGAFESQSRLALAIVEADRAGSYHWMSTVKTS
jgi:hypothetical protein